MLSPSEAAYRSLVDTEGAHQYRFLKSHLADKIEAEMRQSYKTVDRNPATGMVQLSPVPCFFYAFDYSKSALNKRESY